MQILQYCISETAGHTVLSLRCYWLWLHHVPTLAHLAIHPVLSCLSAADCAAFILFTLRQVDLLVLPFLTNPVLVMAFVPRPSLPFFSCSAEFQISSIDWQECVCWSRGWGEDWGMQVRLALNLAAVHRKEIPRPALILPHPWCWKKR